MLVKWSFTSLLTKQTRFKFSGSTKRRPRSLWAQSASIKLMRLIKRAPTAKKDTMEMTSGSRVKCATNGFMKLVLKSKQHLSRSFSLFCSKVFVLT